MIRSFRWLAQVLAVAIVAMPPAAARAATPRQAACRKIVLTGEVSAAQEWKAAFGQGWVFRVLPIDAAKTPPGLAPYSGWDLVVDREQPAGFPDALLLATPPYDSINQREIGTTFGLRAQDAIGWNPRGFRFLIAPQALSQSRKLFARLHEKPADGAAAQQIVNLTRESAAGEFRILDARLTPGVADAMPFAESWARQTAHTAHTFEPAPGGKSTPLGTLAWMKFSITLWLPAGWKAPDSLHPVADACFEGR